MLKEIIGNFILNLGILSGIIVGLDFFLSAKAKRKINTTFESVWLWMEYKKVLDFYKVTPGSEFIITMTALLYILFSFIMSLILYGEYNKDFFGTAAAIILGATLTNTIVFNVIKPVRNFYLVNKEYILNTDELVMIIHRCIGFSFKPIIAIPILILSKIEYGGLLLILFGYPFVILNSLWFFLTIWAFIALFLKPIMFISNKIVYKAISYPKGSMIFFSTFLTVLGSFIKVIDKFI